MMALFCSLWEKGFTATQRVGDHAELNGRSASLQQPVAYHGTLAGETGVGGMPFVIQNHGRSTGPRTHQVL